MIGFDISLISGVALISGLPASTRFDDVELPHRIPPSAAICSDVTVAGQSDSADVRRDADRDDADDRRRPRPLPTQMGSRQAGLPADDDPLPPHLDLLHSAVSDEKVSVGKGASYFSSPNFRGFRAAMENPVAQALYVVKCLYLLVSAWQIRNGYPQLCAGNLLTHAYGLANMVFFKMYVSA